MFSAAAGSILIFLLLICGLAFCCNTWLLLLIITLQASFYEQFLSAMPHTPFQAAIHISFYLLLFVSWLKDTKYFEPDAPGPAGSALPVLLLFGAGAESQTQPNLLTFFI